MFGWFSVASTVHFAHPAAAELAEARHAIAEKDYDLRVKQDKRAEEASARAEEESQRLYWETIDVVKPDGSTVRKTIDIRSPDRVLGEVIFPNTVPPFYDTAFHIAPPPSASQYLRWRAGARAHNRWLAEFCADEPGRRAGIGLIHLNDIDDAIEDVNWIAKNGLRGGVLLP